MACPGLQWDCFTCFLYKTHNCIHNDKKKEYALADVSTMLSLVLAELACVCA